MSLVFKICDINDLEELIEISKSTFITAFEKDNDPSDFKEYIEKAFSEKQITKELTNPNSTFYFVYKKNVLVAYIKLNTGDAQNEFQNDDSVELERIYVLKEFQGQQIGKHILEEVIQIAKEKKVNFLWLGVWEENKGAIKFYERYGFQKTGTHPYYVGNDKQTDWLMKLDF